MTGELCDCFETKRAGVNAILDAVLQVAPTVPVQVWTTEGRFIDEDGARAEPLKTAAANWLALAQFAGRYVPSGSGVLIDIGSTTTDIIPLLDGRPVPKGRTDPQRLGTRELVYTGIRRTPLCALLGGAGAAEWFATTLDVYLVLGLIPEDQADRDTADGRSATRSAAHARLARMLCGDTEIFSADETLALARRLAEKQIQLVQEALHAVVRASCTDLHPPVVLAGAGGFLGRLVLGPVAGIISLAEKLGPEISRCACAYALARLAVEMDGKGS
jgi:probable H4MPT-linked C1 transfer pathway protein